MTKLSGKFYGLFPSPFMQTRISSPDSALNLSLRSVLGDIRNATPNGQPLHSGCNSYSTQESDDQLHRRRELSDIVELVNAKARIYAENTKLDLRVGDLQINACWLTVLEKGEAVEMHTNPNSIFSAIYFVETPQEKSRLRVSSSVGENWPDIPTIERNSMNVRADIINMESGELAVFPSNLINELNRHNSNATHVSLTFTFVIAPTVRA